MNNDRLIGMAKLKTIKAIKTLSDYDFVDLGGGDGASLVNIERRIGGKGIAIEIDKKKVEKAQAMDREVRLGSALDLHKVMGKTKYATCDNFLEHLPDNSAVFEMLEQATRVATDFIFIRHPSFEHLDYLASLGVKPYWSHWRGHTSMVTIAEYMEMFFKLGITNVKIVPVYKIKSTADDKLLPLDAPIDQHNYDPKLHGKKPPTTSFDRDIYYSFDIVAMIPGTKAKLPTLHYHDRENRTTHPNFSIDSSYKEIKNLKIELMRLRNRKVVRTTDAIIGKVKRQR